MIQVTDSRGGLRQGRGCGGEDWIQNMLRNVCQSLGCGARGGQDVFSIGNQEFH
jgi:hypothetical protein